MAQILPRDLTAIPGGVINPAAAIIIDNEDGVFKGTPANVVDAGAPVNSQAAAEAGLVNTGRMTPLRTAQAIAALGVSQDVLASPTGGEMVGYKQSGVGAIDRDITAKGREIVSVLDFGADPTGASASTAAIQAAIDTDAKEIFFPKGVYLHGNLNCNNQYQRFVGPGAQLVRNANSTTITVSARGNQFHGIRFSGGSFTGNNITVTGPEATFQNCDSLDTPDRALYADSDGGNMIVSGGIWNTTTAAGYDIELHDDTPGTSLYTKLIGISTAQASGGVLIDGQGTVRIIGCQIGKLTVSSGGGMFVGNRFNGAVSVQASNNQFANNAYASSVTFGDGSAPNLSGIAFDSTNIAQAATTLTINSDVIESTFHLGQLANVTLVINGPNNDIWHSEIAYTPTLAGSGSPSLGDGSLVGRVSRNGREWVARLEFVMGSTTNLGSSFGFTAPYKAKFDTQGSAILSDSGVGSYLGTATIQAGSATINVLAGAEPIGGILTPTAPFTWVTGDSVRVTISGQYVV